MKRLLLIVMLAFTCQAHAADVVKTIGASGADYTTIADWEADLDDGTNAAINTTAYGSGDVAIGELIDAAYTITSVGINGGETVGLSQIILRPAAGNKHDGTFATGCVINNFTAGNNTISLQTSVPVTIEDLRFNLTGSGNYAVSSAIYLSNSATNGAVVVQRCLFQSDGVDRSSSNVTPVGVRMSSTGTLNSTIQNCVFKDFDSGTGGYGRGILVAYGTTHTILNNTCIGCRVGIEAAQAGPTVVARNNVCVDSAEDDFKGSIDTSQTNITSDGSNGTTTSQTLSQLFADPDNGDYTPLAGSDLIDAGTDLATTPTGVNIDAKGRDRDSEGDTWDVGAIESVSGGGSIAPLIHHYRSQMSR